MQYPAGKFSSVFSVLLLSLCAQPVLSAPLVFDEAVDGDIDENMFAFGVGSNVVSGSSALGVVNDFDGFEFTLPGGSTVTSITYSYSNVVSNAVESFWGMSPQIYTPAYIDLVSDADILMYNTVDDFFGVPDSSPVVLDIYLPFEAGITYTMTYFGSVLDIPDSGGSFDYTMTFNVSEVPLPPAALLFGFGLFGLYRFAARRS